ncbi:MAG: DUF3048 domain-containing protein [Chloroflexi bacterium]|nr:DUF3048 domain-containing protein [Chloroflexota bacterium]
MKRAAFWLLAAAVMMACNLATSRPADLLAPGAQDTGGSGGGVAPFAEASPTAPGSQPIAPAGQAPPAPDSVGPRGFPPNVNPLTGLTVADPAVLDRRPVAVKINNYPRSNRPQWGLSLADIVFEYYHNNDLPRFHAIFYGQDAELAGPIRSGRLLDIALVDIYQSNFVFGSADQRILDRLKDQRYAKRLVYLLEGPCPPQPVCRYEPEGANLLLTGTQAVRDYLLEYREQRDDRPDLEGMWFNVGLPQGGQEINRLYVRYSYGAYLYWQWDATLGRYLRYQDTQEDFNGRGETYELLTDRLTRQPIAADNVVVLLVPHKDFVYQPPADGNPAVEIIEIELEGSGRAYALRDGHLFEVRWMRLDDGVLTLTFLDGSPYPFKPGVTWFEVVSTKTKPQFKDDTVRFNFILR